MKRFLKALVLLPLALIVVLLSVANRGAVRVSLDPFSPDQPMASLEMPLFVALFLCVMLGVVIGGVVVWAAQGKHRKVVRQQRRELERMRVGRVEHRPQSQAIATIPPI
ncbi:MULTISPECIES: lipopolysaccharide assembly protein LapA domain-containing protein [unclassified Chelatococcus]|uniref:lipopolysaccharide assembly protein LapA domain-containing protein n=1 Tax=unclassified Chelatococcus TaxID=2638111 RepID=UPI001BCC54FE|nr:MULTISPECIES: lipopolysaccharide assembly protein LapA domain-containing protein [unclassified Chelatococcus]MBS7696978.1 DUF1049 domain-containing protein [Chelatococcus sp. YT9]MBX3555968.1 DUF1049 domain-containing protein [Chelatococcus sp.]